MDLHEHQQILRRWQRRHGKEKAEAARLRLEVAELQPTPPQFYSTPAKSVHGRCICIETGTPTAPGPAVRVLLDTGTPLCSPEAGAVPLPPPSALDVWVALGENRDRHALREDTKTRQQDRDRQKAVLSAFGWTKDTADETLLLAAKGLWIGTEINGHTGEDRTWQGTKRYQMWGEGQRRSKKQRIQIVQDLCINGFKGRPHAEMQTRWKKEKRFRVARLARVSDMDSSFNPTAVGAIRACEGDVAKGEMGLLCGASTIRRRLQRVHALAVSIGWTWSPPDLHGEGWAWGSDEEGAFKRGVNLYVKLVYHDVCSDEVCAEDPWLVCLTGDAARVSQRGVIVTTCGAKEVDRRLPSQLGIAALSPPPPPSPPIHH